MKNARDNIVIIFGNIIFVGFLKLLNDKDNNGKIISNDTETNAKVISTPWIIFLCVNAKITTEIESNEISMIDNKI